LIDRGLCRTEINKRIGRIKRVFKWAVSEELIAPSMHEGLRTVTGLLYGRTRARESEPVKPVEQRHVELTLPFVAPQIATMARLQLLTGMRPGEVAAMQPRLIDLTDEIWIYQPDKHKNRWRGHRRCVPLGPQSQAILKSFIHRPDHSYLFSPTEAEAWRNQQRAICRNRKTPVYPSELRTREKRRLKSRSRNSKRPKGDCYCSDSYRRAITYGTKKSNRERRKIDAAAELIPSWTPYQLRHTYATQMRKLHGVEAAQLGLGHARTNIVDVYAEKNQEMLIELAKTNG
jgi:integrase